MPPTTDTADEVPRRGETDLFALSFGPGAFDTMVQLGVIHALLVAHRRPPNVVLGLSAGAINAVALGEVFAEPGGTHGQVSRFRELLNAARNSLRVLRHELSPDPLELNTTHALTPMTLPIHHEQERAERAKALHSVAGILRLFNDTTKTHKRGRESFLDTIAPSSLQDPACRAVHASPPATSLITS